MTDEGFGDWLGKQMARCGFGSNVDLEREAGLGNTTISRWRNGVMAPSVDQLRKLEGPLRTPLLELLVRAGILAPDEAKISRERLAKDAAVQRRVSSAEAIKQDPDLVDAAKEHLLNQYEFLRELSETRTSKDGRPSTPGVQRPLRAVARKRAPRRDQP